ncbi:MAG: 2-amino-4-hydroxy-6-hydroxymethyldihydropteridine diphosphokinase [Gammaproteobacteria bacterium]|jgi:2-amino-4-hydroxy-6-hydroxymethyldihydropteridine diphosphokinase
MLSCYIGLGSNIEQPRQQIIRAIAELSTLKSSKLLCVSSLYQSKPLGPQDQPDYVNAVAKLETSLPAGNLLALLQDIELAHDRVRGEHWGPRTLDLDLLLYGDEQIKSEHLTVPHPEIRNRNFVLIPLSEISAELTIPGMGTLVNMVTQVDRSGLEIITAGDYHDE